MPTQINPVVVREHYAEKLESLTLRDKPKSPGAQEVEDVATRGEREASIDDVGINPSRNLKRSLPDLGREITPSPATKRCRSDPLTSAQEPQPGQLTITDCAFTDSDPSFLQNPTESRRKMTHEAKARVTELTASLPDKQRRISNLEFEITQKMVELNVLKEEVEQGHEDLKWFRIVANS